MRTVLFLVASLSATACIKPKHTGDDTGGGDGGSIGGAVSCADMQQGSVATDSIVTLTDVVVTSPITLDGKGFFVQDPGGGAWSGMYIYLQGTFTDLYLQVGDRVSITGTYTEYYDYSELGVTSMDDIQVTGTADVTVTPVTDTTDMEQWEGCLISLADQTFLTCPSSYGEVETSSGLKANDAFFAMDVDRNSTVNELVGTVEYSFSEFKIDPRSTDDLVGFTAGDGCTWTIPDIHQAAADAQAADPKGQVRFSAAVSGVIATSGLTTSGTPGFFVQEAGGGEKSGLFVYLDKKIDTSAMDIQPGDVMDLTGDATVYYDFTELAIYDAADINLTGDTAKVTATPLSTAPADWNFWEGALVTIDSPTATEPENTYGECPLDWGIVIDDWLTSYTATAGTTWDSITGEITYAYSQVGIQPRSAADLVGGNIVTTDATVSDLQDGTLGEGAVVTLTDVIATSGLTADGKGFFVEDAGGGMWSGIYVYVGSNAVTVAAGDQLTIVGTTSEYYDYTELSIGGAADIVKTGTGTVTPTVLSSVPSDWEPYEGVLVTLNGLDVTSDPDSFGEESTSWGSLMLNDSFFSYFDSVSSGDHLSSVTGTISYSYKLWLLNPRDAGDLVP